MKNLLFVAILSLGILSCSDDGINEDYCITQSQKLQKEIDNIEDRMKLGLLSPERAIPMLEEIQEKAYELAKQCD